MSKNLISFLFYSFFALNHIFAQATTLEEYLKANNINAKQSPDGIFYTIEKEGNGKIPRRGNYIRLTYVGKLLDGAIFDQSPEDEAFVFRFGLRQVIEGWEKSFSFFKEGTQATLYIPSTLGYGTRKVGKVPENAPLIFSIKFEKIMNDTEYEKYMEEQEQKAKRKYEQEQKVQFVKDIDIINNFAKAKKLSTTKLASGVQYALTKKGKGTLPQSGDNIAIEYEGFLLDETLFDATKKEPFRFVIGAKKVIAGLEEAIQYFPKGAEGWILIPSKLAYGGLAIKENNIPANSTLFFKIKVQEIKK